MLIINVSAFLLEITFVAFFQIANKKANKMLQHENSGAKRVFPQLVSRQSQRLENPESKDFIKPIFMGKQVV